MPAGGRGTGPRPPCSMDLAAWTPLQGPAVQGPGCECDVPPAARDLRCARLNSAQCVSVCCTVGCVVSCRDTVQRILGAVGGSVASGVRLTPRC